MKKKWMVLGIFLAISLITIVQARFIVHDPDKNLDVEVNGTGLVISDGRTATGILTGTSTDTKPTNVPVGTRFIETDTDKMYWWDGVDWSLVAGSGVSSSGSGGGNYSLATYIVSTNPNDDADFIVDGVDDQVEINQAIQQCTGTEYCMILLLNGTYYLNNSINITVDKVILKGQNAKLIYRNGFHAIYVNSNYVKIDSIFINNTDCALDISGSSNGIRFDGASHFEVANSEIWCTGSDAIYGSYAEPGFIHDNKIFSQKGRYGAIHPHGQHEWVITDNYVYDSNNHCVRHGWIIANNICVNSGDDGTIHGGDDGSIIANNYIYNTDKAFAIRAWQNNTVIIGNRIDLTRSGNTYAYGDIYGIYVGGKTSSSPLSNIVVSGNVISNIEGAGIYLTTVERAVVSDNILVNVGYEGDDNAIMLVNSTNIIVTNNMVFDDGVNPPLYGVADNGTSDYNRFFENMIFGVANGKYLVAAHTYADEYKYTSLPTDGFSVSGVPVWFNDGTGDYLAFWNGTAWVKTAFS